ncbi:MAG: hypothetical protein ABJN75_07085 [Hoeflea sp.]|uniref:hypothetical protein n=1 Tax=Hoeflea sp. TaxID=1940281 RepID=UPI003296998B
MPDNIFGGQGATLLTAVLIVAIALLALVGVFWVIRSRSSSTFIRGGKNRQPRLAVLDAAAVDTRRRLVLIRRDDVEHLVMIGGPTDIVIESRIVHPAGGGDVSPPPRQTAPPRTEPVNRPAPAAVQRQAAPAKPQPRQPRADPAPDLAQAPPPLPQVPVSPAATISATAASTVGSIRAEASEVLESARTRVFEEPSFDELAYDELTAALDTTLHPEPASAPAPAPASTTPPREPMQAHTPQPAGLQRATAAPAAPAPAARPVAGDFESVLAAELSDDLSLDISDDGFFDPLEDQPQPASVEKDQAQAPEVMPDSQPSRDSLEAEMERLLGDLSRKP